MFSSFLKTLPQISIFHNPASPTSTRALALLKAALSGPYPPPAPQTTPSSSHTPHTTPAPPLAFRLDVVRGTTPTPEQFGTILKYLPPGCGPLAGPVLPTYAAFLAAPSEGPRSDDVPQTAEALARLAVTSPGALRWPIVVHWDEGMASLGDVVGVVQILEALRRRRDGEAAEG